MSRRFTAVTVALTALVAFFVGIILSGRFAEAAPVAAGPRDARPVISAARPESRTAGSLPVNFADVVQRVNPAVVNVEAASSAGDTRRPGSTAGGGSNRGGPREAPRRGAGSGFI